MSYTQLHIHIITITNVDNISPAEKRLNDYVKCLRSVLCLPQKLCVRQTGRLKEEFKILSRFVKYLSL